MSSNTMLFGLDDWVGYLRDKELPIRVSTLVRLKRALNDDRTTLVDLGHLVRSDPVLSLHVTRLAQEKHAAKGSQVTSVDHAIASLGFGQVETLASELGTIKLHAHNMAQKRFFRSIADSQHAATQAASWVQQKHLPFVEEARLAALFYALVHWLLWLYAPLHKDKFLSDVIENNASPVEAERRIFGCSTQDIGKVLAEQWRLTPLTIDAMDHSTSPSLSELKQLHMRAIKDPRLEQSDMRHLNHLVQQHYYPVKLANWMALTVSRGWNSSRATRMFDIISDYLDLPLPETRAQLHSNCAQAARDYYVPGVMTAAAELLLNPSVGHLPYRLTERELKVYESRFPDPSQVPDSEPVETADDAADWPEVEESPALLNPYIYRQVMQRLEHGYDLYTQPAHVLHGLLQGLHRGIGLERVALWLVKNRDHRLVTARVLGVEEDDPNHGFAADLLESPLLRRLCAKPAFIAINDDNRDQIRNALPEAHRDWITANDCVLMSVFQDRKPVAVIFADRNGKDGPLHSFYQEHFRSLCTAATLALKRLSAPSP